MVVVVDVGCGSDPRVGSGTLLTWLGWEAQLQLGIDNAVVESLQ